MQADEPTVTESAATKASGRTAAEPIAAEPTAADKPERRTRTSRRRRRWTSRRPRNPNRRPRRRRTTRPRIRRNRELFDRIEAGHMAEQSESAVSAREQLRRELHQDRRPPPEVASRAQEYCRYLGNRLEPVAGSDASKFSGSALLVFLRSCRRSFLVVRPPPWADSRYPLRKAHVMATKHGSCRRVAARVASAPFRPRRHHAGAMPAAPVPPPRAKDIMRDGARTSDFVLRTACMSGGPAATSRHGGTIEGGEMVQSLVFSIQGPVAAEEVGLVVRYSGVARVEGVGSRRSTRVGAGSSAPVAPWWRPRSPRARGAAPGACR